MEKVTMADVALRANVHQGTVSRALRNDPRLPLRTRERIQALAEALGYRPNPLVSALIAERKTGVPSSYGSTLAFLTSGESRDQWSRTSRRYAASRECIARFANRRGYTLEDFWMNEAEMSRERLCKIFRYRGIRGIVVCPLQGQHKQIDFDFRDFATVAVGYTLREPMLDHVAVDYYSLMKVILDRLINNQYGRIGFITPGTISDRVRNLSLGAFLSEKHRQTRRLLAPLVTPHDLDKASVLKWLREKRPDVVICPTNAVWVILRDWLSEAGLRVPADISLVCADCHKGSEASGIVHDLEAEASAVVELVTSRIERGIFGIPRQPQTILVGGSWQQGKSLLLREPATT